MQTCIVHLIRHSLRFDPDKYRRAVAKDLKPYTAVDVDAVAAALAAFEASWGERQIEALHRQIHKTIKTRGHFPTEEAARN